MVNTEAEEKYKYMIRVISCRRCWPEGAKKEFIRDTLELAKNNNIKMSELTKVQLENILTK
jgi:hypothetical protein